MAFEQTPLDINKFPGGSQMIVGRVTNVILSPYTDDGKTLNPEYKSPSDIGKIRYELLYQNKQASKTDYPNRPAYPLFSFVKQYPVIGEIILLINGPGPELNENKNLMRTYYFPSYNLWNSPNNNVFPDLAQYAGFVRSYYEKPNYNYVTGSGMPEFPKGAYFTEKPIKNLTPFEGDTIIEGRFGQSIRFGSTSTLKKSENNWSSFGKDGNPITIIRNGQGRETKLSGVGKDTVLSSTLPDQPTIENINYDSSSIYLTAGQPILINDISSFPFKSYGITIQSQNTEATKVVVTERIPVANEINSARENDSK